MTASVWAKWCTPDNSDKVHEDLNDQSSGHVPSRINNEMELEKENSLWAEDKQQDTVESLAE